MQMKKIVFLSLVVLLASATASGQGIDFRHITFKEALELAKKENKAIFIDIFTSWCGPCKALSTEVFPLAEVGEAFNSRFICIKADAEKSEDGKLIAKTFNVTAYPTLLFVNGDSELVYRFLGFKKPDEVIAEANKAQAAFKAFPTLMRYEARYRGGERGKDFLLEYSDQMSASGMEPGRVLADYFNLLSDSEVMDSLNVARIAKLTVMDDVLTPRLIEMDILESSLKRLDKKSLATFNKNIGTYLGACINQAARLGTPEQFEQSLEYKKRYFTIPGNGNSIVVAGLGGGTIYVPSEMTSMDFYASKKMGDRFVAVYDGYLNSLKAAYPEKKAAKEALEKEMAEKLAAAEKTGTEKEIKTIKAQEVMLGLFVGIDDYYAVASLVENADKYIEFHAGPKGKAFDDQLAANYLFLNEYYPSCTVAVEIAGKLISMNRKAEARQVLSLAMAKGTKAFNVKEEQVEECRKMLESLE